MSDIDGETATLVRELTSLIIPKNPAIACRALCDILGVLTGHVLTGLEGDKRAEMLEQSLLMIRRDVTSSYFMYLEYAKRNTQ